MGPLIVNDIISSNTNLFLAFLIGIAFGFILESSGFSSSRKLVGIFYGYDTVVLKVFFTGAITAMLGLLFFSLFGWIDLTYIYINPTYLWSTLIGGVIMGAGFILGGFCPGTSVCAAAIGKIDAMIFVLGIFIGIFIFTEGYPLWEGLYMAEFMGYLKMNTFFNISSGTLVVLVIVAAIVMFWIGEMAEKKFKAPKY
ncbi:MAG: YeeE/YedE thiosulfate transporter family protein [Bacteroidota bacterium]|nr:YeeE/YedE thiosulfate transporter family protein [Bacteroidota bacterium]